MTHRSALARLCAGSLGLAEGWTDWAEARAEMALAATQIAGQGACVPDALAWSEAQAAACGDWRPYDLAGGVAVIPVQGLILPNFPFLGWDIATGCAQLRWQIREALADDQVQGVALLVDSPGGYVAGVDDTAAAIRAAREEKPVAAVVEASAYSSAYWLASSADTISAPRTGGVGSIGVMCLHLDVTGWLEGAGVKPTLFRSGARKAEGHPMEPLSDAARAAIQADIDALREVFAASVGEGRGAAMDAAAALATEARAYQGPAALEEALSLGLLDAILPAEEALGLFAEAVSAPAADAAA